MTNPLNRRQAVIAAASALALGPIPAAAQLRSGDNPDASENWQKVRAGLFKDRPIRSPADDLLTIEAPNRAEDAAVVPIAIRTASAAGSPHVRKLWLVIDNNPSPVAATFDFRARSGRSDIETRVRVDEYTFVRAIAETDDGKLHMSTRFVKASGGCSAPPGKDQAAALASLGRIKMRVEGDVVPNRPVLAQLMISHPNDSGMAMDQLTRQFTPAHFVRQVNVSYGGEPVLSADLDFSISENPNLRFWFVPSGEGELKAEIVDSKDLRFESGLKLRAPG